MRALAEHDAPHALVWDTAMAVTGGAESLDACLTLRAWVNARFRFEHDPPNMEFVQSPEAQLRFIARDGFVRGDCDDAATLVAGLALAAGLWVRMVAVAFLDKPNVFRHVWSEIAPKAGPDGVWIECDVTRPFQSVPVERIARILVQPVT